MQSPGRRQPKLRTSQQNSRPVQSTLQIWQIHPQRHPPSIVLQCDIIGVREAENYFCDCYADCPSENYASKHLFRLLYDVTSDSSEASFYAEPAEHVQTCNLKEVRRPASREQTLAHSCIVTMSPFHCSLASIHYRLYMAVHNRVPLGKTS